MILERDTDARRPIPFAGWRQFASIRIEPRDGVPAHVEMQLAPLEAEKSARDLQALSSRIECREQDCAMGKVEALALKRCHRPGQSGSHSSSAMRLCKSRFYWWEPPAIAPARRQPATEAYAPC